MDRLALAVRAILPEGIALAAADPGKPQPPLWPGERIPPAVPARQREFAAGRTAARAALQAAGQAARAIPVGADRAPVWPPGVTGSISHCAGACLAIVTDSALYAGVGVDLEPLHPIAAELWPAILHPQELLGVVKLPVAEAGFQVLRIFVAKEAAYKAQFALSRAMIGFDALQIGFSGDGFAARFSETVPPFAAGAVIRGRFTATDDHIAAVAWVLPGEQPDAAEMRPAQETRVQD